MFDNVISLKLELSKEECYGSITDLYDTIAKKLGQNHSRANYNCTKICVTKAVQDLIFNYYREELGFSEMAIGQMWLSFGPKANLPYNGCIIDIQKGFIVEEGL